MMTSKELIRASLSIEDVVKKYGFEILPGQKMRCPFHGEDTHPSASVKCGFFYCFSCCERLDIFAFIQKMEGVNFVDALKMAAGMAGLSPDLQYDTENFAQIREERQRKQAQVAHARKISEYKYCLLAVVSLVFMQNQNAILSNWHTMLNELLDAWIREVPAGINVRSLSIAYSHGNIRAMGKAVERIYAEATEYGGYDGKI